MNSDLENMPVYIGQLNTKQGLNGFEIAEAGHPVFQFKERYVIFLKCLTKTAEQIPDGKGGHTKVMIEYNVMVPYYRNTLKPIINFL